MTLSSLPVFAENLDAPSDKNVVVEDAAPKKESRKMPCNCLANSFDIRWHDASAVFSGTVKDIRVVESFRQYSVDDLPVEVTMYVDEGYKGVKAGDTFTLFSSLTRETCTGHPFEKSQHLLIFAFQRTAERYEAWSLYNFPSGTYDVGGLCGGTQKLGTPEAAAEYKLIQKKLNTPEPKKSILEKIFN